MLMLSGILPVLIWLVASILLIKFIVRPAGNFVRRSFIKILVFIVVFILPLADEFVGRLHFNYLCKTDAGFKVYQTVELSEEYWDENGNSKIFNEQGYLERDFWIKRIDENGGQVKRYSSLFSIDKDISTVVYENEKKLLGDITTFRYWGGWFRQRLGGNTANTCQFINDPNFSRKFYGGLFKPTSEFKKGDN